jgi:hypothetical protein
MFLTLGEASAVRRHLEVGFLAGTFCRTKLCFIMLGVIQGYVTNVRSKIERQSENSSRQVVT